MFDKIQHIEYLGDDLYAGTNDCSGCGFQFVAAAPATNSIGQQVLYFDTACTRDSRMHLTQRPPD